MNALHLEMASKVSAWADGTQSRAVLSVGFVQNEFEVDIDLPVKTWRIAIAAPPEQATVIVVMTLLPGTRHCNVLIHSAISKKRDIDTRPSHPSPLIVPR